MASLESSNATNSWISVIDNNKTITSPIYTGNETFSERNLLVPMVFIGCLSVIGVPGNALILVVFNLKHKPSVHRTIILTLATYDFLLCGITLPFEIYDMNNQFTFHSRFRSKSQLKNQTSVIRIISIEGNTTCNRSKTEYNHKRCKISNYNKAASNAGDRTSYKSTLIAVIVSVFFIISYVPTLTENVLEAIYGEEYIGMFISLPVRNIIEKTFAINHVVNPFIYGFLDTKFRTDCREILHGC
ncbi:uncharacterized protein LOC134684547 [Mytilus trossulus]|uniref:uncharacterized protein LOC134684547 n=1 Tax=Mytilus trossulus TaxID=6551 RepID=UPI00300428E5